MSGEGGEEDHVVNVEATLPASVAATTSTTTSTTTTATQPVDTAASSSTLATQASPSQPTGDTAPSTTTTALLTPTTPAPTASPAQKTKVEEEEVEEEGSGAEEHPATTLEQLHLSPEQLAVLSKEELTEKWLIQEKYVENLHLRLEASEREVEELRSSRENEERLKGQLAELQRKEQYHIMRLSCKEQEIQDMGVQVQELKGISVGGAGSLKHCLLDPAVNLLFERLKRDLDSARTKMEETQNELSAWKFTPDSNTGKQLMAKCRLLIKENEDLGRMITSGRIAKLEGDLALQRNFSEELKKSQSELDEFLLEMDEDTEGMQGTIYYLQQQLRQAKERIAQLSSQVALTQTPEPPQLMEDSSAQVVAESGAAELVSEAERTEERTRLSQPNGDAPHNEVMSDSYEVDISTATPLTNGQKRTQSEIDAGSEVVDGSQDQGENGSEVAGASLGPPCKRTRTEGEEEVSGAGEESAVGLPLENGVVESE